MQYGLGVSVNYCLPDKVFIGIFACGFNKMTHYLMILFYASIWMCLVISTFVIKADNIRHVGTEF